MIPMPRPAPKRSSKRPKPSSPNQVAARVVKAATKPVAKPSAEGIRNAIVAAAEVYCDAFREYQGALKEAGSGKALVRLCETRDNLLQAVDNLRLARQGRSL